MTLQCGDWAALNGEVGRIQGMLIENGEVKRFIVCTLEDKIKRWAPDGVTPVGNPFEGPTYQPAA